MAVARKANAQTHGDTSGGKISVEYNSWRSMLSRCSNPSDKSYPSYGARGIRVCEKWAKSYSAFLADVGRRPTTKHTLDRRDTDGDYKPGNVRWATQAEQQNNRRNNVVLTYKGQTMSLFAWSAFLGIPKSTLFKRHHRGLSVEAVLSHVGIRRK